MSYKALYRKYRPQNFETVAGQKYITKTLQNALRKNKIAHAYLFSGPRGIGKTSIAKIFAKAVNCQAGLVEEPCNKCEICKGIDSGEIGDVIEIDAASNNGVEEIRELRDKVKYLPSVGRYKVYIVDEVHMLSIAAFNALLKTLEEPPKHVIFILCTTEPHKIPLTIHSRCQRFDFRPLSVEEIINKIMEICELENINISKEAAELIAQSAEGGMRDALSLLDQAVSYSGEKIEEEDVLAVSGSVSDNNLLDIFSFIYKNDISSAVKMVDELVNAGKEISKIIPSMIVVLKDILMSKNMMTERFAKEYKHPQYFELSKNIPSRMIYHYIDVLANTLNQIKYSNNHKIYFELALIKMADKEENSQISLLSRIEELEKKLANTTFTANNERPRVEVKQEKEIIVPKTNAFVETKKEDPIEEKKVVVVQEEQKDKDITEDKKPIPNSSVSEEASIESKDNEKASGPKQVVVTDDLDETYSIEFIESVLNNGNRAHKEMLNAKWDRISHGLLGKDTEYISMLEDTSVVASNGERIIIEFAEAAECNLIMRNANRTKVEECLSKILREDLKIMALPTETWREVSKEFIDKFRDARSKGYNTYIKLSKIKNPKLRNVNHKNDDDNDSKQNNEFQDIVDIFGDIVKID